MAREVKVHWVAVVGKTAQLDTGPVALLVCSPELVAGIGERKLLYRASLADPSSS